jgi:cobalt/nickel transport system permease protein
LHIPDGLMSPEIWMLGYVLALPVVAYAVSKVSRTIDEKTVPFMAILAAGIFVAMMLNFPVGGGTTGHLLGAALVVLLLGVWGGVVVITVVLIIQCLVFGDGGVTALGLNLLNMAVIAPLTAGIVLRAFSGKFQYPSIFLAAWSSVFLAAMTCAVELALSFTISGGQYGISDIIVLPTMAGWHLLIGIGEGIITFGVVVFLSNVAPETLRMSIAEKTPEVTI